MTSIPLSKDEVHAFTPASLANILPQPIFRFRAATMRDAKRYGHALTVAGLRLFQEDAVRAEMLRVLEANWSPGVFEKERQRLENIWAKIDQQLDINADEQSAVAELTMRCIEISPMLRRMDADNRRFADEAPAVALSMFIAGWSNLETEFELEAGQVSEEAMIAIQRELKAIEDRAKTDNVAGVVPGLAFMELSLHAFSLMQLDEGEAKNSPAPSPSSETPNGSKTKTPRDGASKPAKARTSSARGKTQRKPSLTTSES